jgi:hypothetical protein
MRELEHRRDSLVSIRDFLLEIAVIALIGWEIHMSYRAEHLQSSIKRIWNGRLQTAGQQSCLRRTRSYLIQFIPYWLTQAN